MSHALLQPDIDELSASFDEILDRVKSRIQSLADQASDACRAELDSTEQNELQRADEEVRLLTATLQECDGLEARVTQLEGLYQITRSLRQVVAQLDKKL